MKRFELKSAHISSAMLNEGDFIPSKLINIQLKFNIEAAQDDRSSGFCNEDILEELKKEISKIDFKNIDENQKYSVNGMFGFQDMKVIDSGFGWYQI